MSNAREILEQHCTGYEIACILGAAAELDLFRPLVTSPMTAAELTQHYKTSLRGVVTLLDALAAFDFLTKTDEPEPRYSLSDGFAELLDPLHPNTYIPMLRHRMNCLRQWVGLAHLVKTGVPSERVGSILGPEEDYRSFVLAMNSIGIVHAPETAQKLCEIGCVDFKHLLDVGGASGTYTRALLDVAPNARATVFDVPAAIEEARKSFAGTSYESRVSLVGGDFFVDELPTGTDFAWVSAIIHMFNRIDSQKLYQKIFRVLEPGGRIAIRDFVMQPNRIQPANGTLFAVNMLTGTRTGMCYTFDEIKEDLEISGFQNVVWAYQAKDMGSVVIAKKPLFK